MKRFTSILITSVAILTLIFPAMSSAASKKDYDFIEIKGTYSEIVQQTGNKASGWINSEPALVATAGLLFAMDIHLDNQNFLYASEGKSGSMFIGADLADKSNRILDFILLGEDGNYAFGYYDLKTNKLYYRITKFDDPGYAALAAGIYVGTYFNQDRSIMLRKKDIEKGLQFLASQYAELLK